MATAAAHCSAFIRAPHTFCGVRPQERRSGNTAALRNVFKGCKLNISSSSSQNTCDESKRNLSCRAETYTVELEHNGEVVSLQVPDDETILTVALDSGLDLPYDCNLGVCMTCPAKVTSGIVDQSEGMLSDDVQEAGYALMCASYPRSDCKIRVIPEEELLSLQLATAND